MTNLTNPFNRIQAALFAPLAAWATGLSMPVSWPNFKLDPDPTVPYLRVTLMPADVVAMNLGDSFPMDYHSGILQVDIFYPSGKGDGDAMATAGDIAALYPRGSVKTADSQPVTIRTCSVGKGRPEGNFYAVPLLIKYDAQVFAS